MAKKPEIVVFDLETSDLSADVGSVLCAGWKILGKKKTNVIKIDNYELFDDDPTNDYAVVEEMGDVLRNADAWIGWYSMKFDAPYLNSRLLFHDLPPIPPMTTATHLDGWRVARYKMKLRNNRLATVAAFFGVEEKTHLDLRIWKRASAGHRPSLKYVYEHCRQDLIVTEQVYEKIKVLDPMHFNINIISGREDACPNCGVQDNFRKGGRNLAQTSWSQRYQCTSCGKWCSGTRQPIKKMMKR